MDRNSNPRSFELVDGIPNPDQFSISIAFGYVPGWRNYRRFGMNDKIPSNGNTVDMWPSATRRTLPTAAATAEIVSASSDDSAAGTGARTVVIQGLDANYVEIEETIILNGTTPVVSTLSYLRINRAFCDTAGTDRSNDGDIDISVGGDLQCLIEASEGESQIAMDTVPAGHTLVVKSIGVGVGRMGGNSSATVSLSARAPAADSSWHVLSDFYLYNGQSFVTPPGSTIFIPEKYEIRSSITSTSKTQAFGIIYGYLIANTHIQ